MFNYFYIILKISHHYLLICFRFTFTDHLRNDLEIGPVFQPKFLKEVLKLQQRIEGLKFEFEEESGMVNTFNLSEVIIFHDYSKILTKYFIINLNEKKYTKLCRLAFPT